MYTHIYTNKTRIYVYLYVYVYTCFVDRSMWMTNSYDSG